MVPQHNKRCWGWRSNSYPGLDGTEILSSPPHSTRGMILIQRGLVKDQANGAPPATSYPRSTNKVKSVLSLLHRKEKSIQPSRTKPKANGPTPQGREINPIVPYFTARRNTLKATSPLYHTRGNYQTQSYTRGLGLIVRALRYTQTDRIAGVRQEWTAAKSFNDKKAGAERKRIPFRRESSDL